MNGQEVMHQLHGTCSIASMNFRSDFTVKTQFEGHTSFECAEFEPDLHHRGAVES